MTIEAAARRSHDQLGIGSSLTIAALGVVYGDIGTSPLYAVRQSLVDFGDLSERAILGALSLIVWALTLVVTVKYVLVIMRADNRGAGGLLALTALVLRTTRQGRKRYMWIMAAGLVGAALFYGDGVITPAISVLSAVEGLKVATRSSSPMSFRSRSLSLQSDDEQHARCDRVLPHPAQPRRRTWRPNRNLTEE